ncbi:MAG: hypothetical protein Q4F67_06830, partial [Propionibacteriaceae bacterium]|nr:hypothetical protein [Propionibacteriaceae bacterium]
MNTPKRAAAVILSAGLGLGIAGLAAPHAFAAPVPVEFRNDQGADETRPQYVRLAPSDLTLTSFGSLYTQVGEPISGRTVAVYLYTNGVRGEQLGSGATDASGVFRFDSALPSGWSSQDNFNVQLAFDDTDDTDGVDLGSASAVLRPVAEEDDDEPTEEPTATPSTTPSA